MLGDSGESAWTHSGLCVCCQWGEEDGSEHPLKQNRFQHFPHLSTHKPEIKVHHNIDARILAAGGSGFGLKARDELKISCS